MSRSQNFSARSLFWLISVGFGLASCTATVSSPKAIVTGPPTVPPTALTAVFSTSAPAITNSSILPITLTFNRAVTDFTLGKVIVTNGTASNLTGSGAVYNFNVAPTANADVALSLAANLVQDSAGVGNSAPTPISVLYDNVSPGTAAPVTNASWSSSTTASPAVSWTAAIDTGANASGINRYEYSLGTTAGATNIQGWTSTGTTTSVTATGLVLTNNTTYYANVRVVDRAGNTSNVASDSGWLVAPPIPVTLTLATGADTNVPFSVNVSFNTAVTGLTAGMFTVTNGSVSALSGSGTTYVATVTPAGDGTITMSLAANQVSSAVGTPNAVSNTLSAVADIIVTTVNFAKTNSVYNEANQTASVTLNFSQAKGFPVDLNLSWANAVSTATNPANTGLPLHSVVTMPAGLTSVTKSFALSADNTTNPSRDIMLTLAGTSTRNALVGRYDQNHLHIVDADGGNYGPFAYVTNYGGYDTATCGITTAGVLECWGSTWLDGIFTSYTPQVIDAGTKYIAVTSGWVHTCGITDTNVLKCWGRNYYGGLGVGNGVVSEGSPTVVDSGVSYLAVSAGGYNTCGITTDHAMKCWGDNTYGQVGDGTTQQANSPVAVDSVFTYSAVSTKGYATCGIRADNGELRCWGANYQGQLGDGSGVQQKTAVPVDSGTSYLAIARGQSALSCGVTTAHKIKCWSGGALGISSTTPVLFDNAEDFSQVSVTLDSACGLRTDGTLECFGNNRYLQLGDGQLAGGATNSYTPVVVDSGVTYAQVSDACAVTTNGILKCWGYNDLGNIGSGQEDQTTEPIDIDSSLAFNSLSVATSHSCGVTSTGALFCWGVNTFGVLGDGTTYDRSSLMAIDPGTAYTLVSTSDTNTCGVTSSGALKCWGDNTYQQVPGATQTLLPTVVDEGINYLSVSAGQYGICGITSVNVLKCWGSGAQGQLGDGAHSDHPTPFVIDSGVAYASVKMGYGQTCGITSVGSLKCWGANSANQVGNNSTAEVDAPTLIDSGVSYSEVSLGNQISCGVTTGAVVKCWGSNRYYRLGQSSQVNSYNATVPEATTDAATTFSHVTVGQFVACANTTGNVLKCWGSGDQGEFASGQGGIHYSPMPISDPVSYTNAQVGGGFVCGRKTNGNLRCWGTNRLGVTGNARSKFPNPIN